MALNSFKCNHLMSLHFKGLRGHSVWVCGWVNVWMYLWMHVFLCEKLIQQQNAAAEAYTKYLGDHVTLLASQSLQL